MMSPPPTGAMVRRDSDSTGAPMPQFPKHEATCATDDSARSHLIHAPAGRERATAARNLWTQLQSNANDRPPSSISPLSAAEDLPQPEASSTSPQVNFQHRQDPPDHRPNVPSNGAQSIPSPESMSEGNDPAPRGPDLGTGLPVNAQTRNGEALPIPQRSTTRNEQAGVREEPIKREVMDESGLSGMEERTQASGFAMCQFDDGNFVITTFQVEFGRDIRAIHEAKMQLQTHNGQKQRETALWTQTAGSVISEGAGIMGLDHSPDEDEEASFVLPDLVGSESSAAVDPRELEISRPLPEFDYSGAADQQIRLQMSGENVVQSGATDPSHPDPNRTILVPIHTASTDPHDVIHNQKQISQRHIKIFWSPAEARWQLQVLGRNGAFHLIPNPNPGSGSEYVDEYLYPWKMLVPKGSHLDIGGSPDDRVARLEKAKCDEPEGLEEKFARSLTGEAAKIVDGVEMVWEYSGPYNLYHGYTIQVQGVTLTFKLPSAGREQSPSEYSDSDEDDLDDGERQRLHRSTTSTSVEGPMSAAPRGGAKSHGEPGLATSATFTSPDGLLQAPKRRGPGRPPKDGISSTRQKREEAKARKEAEARAANGGRTPPPLSSRSKPTKSQNKPAEPLAEPVPAKRKYTKRRRPEDDVVPSIEAADDAVDDEADAEAGAEESKVIKRSKRQKSPSPQPRPRHEYTAEELAEPTENYAVMLHKILMKHSEPLPLRKIYHAVCEEHPIFYFKDTKGWQSSVRHNLNGSSSKGEPNGFIKGPKDGKGFFWSADPNWSYPKENERRRQTQQSQSNKTHNNAPAIRSQPHQTFPLVSQWPVHPGNMAPPHGQPPIFYGHGTNVQAQQHPPSWNLNGASHHPADMIAHASTNGPNASHLGPPNSLSSNQNMNSMHIQHQQPQSQGGPMPGPMLQPPNSQQQFVTNRPTSSQGFNNHHSPQPSRPSSAQVSGAQAQNFAANAQAAGVHDSLLPSIMPCTLEGRARINNFERIMLEDTRAPDFIRIVFNIVRGRELHGKTGSSVPPALVPDGAVLKEVEDEITQGIKTIIKAHANPRFTGFAIRPEVDVTDAAAAANEDTQLHDAAAARGENEGDDEDAEMEDEEDGEEEAAQEGEEDETETS